MGKETSLMLHRTTDLSLHRTIKYALDMKNLEREGRLLILPKGEERMNKVKFAKVKPNAIIPSKRDEDMGFDIYACFDEDYMVIESHTTKLIPTGIASACDSGYGFLLRERGSTGSKGIALRCGVIDSGYRNEWFVGLTNTNNRDIILSKLSLKELIDKYGLKDDVDIYIPLNPTLLSTHENRLWIEYEDGYEPIIYPYSKAIAQALVVEVPKVKVEEVSYDELKAIESERGMGALGSSQK